MFSASFIIAAAFRLLNFGILVALGVWVFYKYVYSLASDQIAERESFVNGLLQQNAALTGKQRKVEEQIAQQALLYKYLSQRVLLWQDEYNKQCTGMHAEQEQNRVVNRQRLKKRAELHEFNERYKQIVVHALDAAERELVVNNGRAGDFLDRVVASLKKEG